MTLPDSYQITPLDEITPPLFFGKVYAFPCHDRRRESTLHVLQQGYTELLRRWPYLGWDIVRNHHSATRPGEVSLIPPTGPLDTTLATVDLSKTSKDWSYSYAQVLEAGLPPSWLHASIFAPYAAGVKTTTKPFEVQVNWIPGGCLLTTCFSHAVVDGYGNSQVISTWARLCREIQGVSSKGQAAIHKISTPKAHVRVTVAEIEEPEASLGALKTRTELWNLLGLDGPNSLDPSPNAFEMPLLIPTAGPSPKKMRTVVYSFSRAAGSRLKADATPLEQDKWISTNDAITALIWRSVMRARNPRISRTLTNEDDPKAIVYVGLDSRSLFEPKLPTSHINNTILNCITEMPLSEIVGEGSRTLGTLASAIRQELNTIKSNPSLIHDARELASLLPDVGRLASVFKPFGANSLATSNWVNFPYYDADFGPVLGKPDFVRVPRGQWTAVTDMFCLLGPRKRNGDVEVYISLLDHEMERFERDAEFLEYATFVCE